MAWLKFLKQHNPLYKDVDINDRILDTYLDHQMDVNDVAEMDVDSDLDEAIRAEFETADPAATAASRDNEEYHNSTMDMDIDSLSNTGQSEEDLDLSVDAMSFTSSLDGISQSDVDMDVSVVEPDPPRVSVPSHPPNPPPTSSTLDSFLVELTTVVQDINNTDAKANITSAQPLNGPSVDIPQHISEMPASFIVTDVDETVPTHLLYEEIKSRQRKDTSSEKTVPGKPPTLHSNRLIPQSRFSSLFC